MIRDRYWIAAAPNEGYSRRQSCCRDISNERPAADTSDDDDDDDDDDDNDDAGDDDDDCNGDISNEHL